METVTVSAKALYQVLSALNGPGHHIRELQALRGGPENPIDKLISEYRAAAVSQSPGPNWLTWERLKDSLAIFVTGACNNPERGSLTPDDWADRLDQMAARQTAFNPLREIKSMLAEKI